MRRWIRLHRRSLPTCGLAGSALRECSGMRIGFLHGRRVLRRSLQWRLPSMFHGEKRPGFRRNVRSHQKWNRSRCRMRSATTHHLRSKWPMQWCGCLREIRHRNRMRCGYVQRNESNERFAMRRPGNVPGRFANDVRRGIWMRRDEVRDELHDEQSMRSRL